MEECDQEEWSIFHKFGVMTSCLATDHLEVDGPTTLIAVTKVSLRGKPSKHLLVLKTCLEDILKTCLEDVLKTS